MGYDSRIIVVDKSNVVEGYAKELCQFSLCAMGCDTVDGKLFYDIFTNEIDFDLSYMHRDVDGWDDDIFRRDRYGKSCKWTTLDAVITWLTTADVDYRRARTLLEVLKGIKKNESEYEQICVVHFGE